MADNNGSSGFKATSTPVEKTIPLTVVKGEYTNKAGQKSAALQIQGLKKFVTIDGLTYEDRNRQGDTMLLFGSSPQEL